MNLVVFWDKIGIFLSHISKTFQKNFEKVGKKMEFPLFNFVLVRYFYKTACSPYTLAFREMTFFLIRSVILESGFSSHPPRVPSTQNSRGEIKLKLPGQDFNHLFWNTVCIPSTITQHFPSDNFYYQNNLNISFPSFFLYLNDFYASFCRPVIKAIPTRRPPLCDPKTPHWGEGSRYLGIPIKSNENSLQQNR